MVDYDEMEKLRAEQQGKRAEQQEKEALRRKQHKQRLQKGGAESPRPSALAVVTAAAAASRGASPQVGGAASARSSPMPSAAGATPELSRLLDSAPKLTAEGRARIDAFLSNTERARAADAPNEESFLLTEKREYIEGNTKIQVEQWHIKLTFAPVRKWVKVRKRKKFRNPKACPLATD